MDATRLLDLGTVYETRGMPSQALTLYRGADYLWQYPENSGMLHMHALCRRLRLDLSRLDEIGRNICSDIVADNHWIVDGQFANSELVAWAKLGEYQTGFVSYRSDQTTGQPPPSLEIRRNNLPLGKENGIYQFVPMQPGERVRFSAWFRIEKQGEFATRLLYVGWQDLQGRAAGNDGARIAQTTDWIFLEREFELISKTPQRVQFAPALFTGSATLWIDDVRLELLPK
ncbi:MAG: hypothetical protein IT328_14475 [Caldilineaceae bacterium]|nr:hypothetical protein [Caldilineaceae bacterium]